MWVLTRMGFMLNVQSNCSNLYGLEGLSVLVVNLSLLFSWLVLTMSCDVSFCFNRWSPYSTATTKCMICKQQVHQDGKYCHTCAYSKGKIVFTNYISIYLFLPLII